MHRVLAADGLTRLERAAIEFKRPDLALEAAAARARLAAPNGVASSIESLAATSDSSAESTICRVARGIEAELDLRTHALTDAPSELEAYFAALTAAMASARERLDAAQRMVDARARSTYTDFREHAGRFLEYGGERAHRALDARLRTSETWHGPTYRRDAVTAVQDIARATVRRWLRAVEADAADWYRAVMQWFIEMLQPVWLDLAQPYRDLCALPDAKTLALELSAQVRFRFTEHTPIASLPSTRRYFADLLGGGAARKRIGHEAGRYLDWLLMLNVGQADNALTDAVDKARGSLYVRARNTLEETIAHAHRVGEQAQRVREAGALKIATELNRLNRERASLAAVRESVGAGV